MEKMNKRIFAIPWRNAQYDRKHKGDENRSGTWGLNQR